MKNKAIRPKQSATMTRKSRDFANKAAAEHNAIRAQAQELSKQWTELARRCIAFRAAKYHKAITDPATGTLFRSFAKWARSVFDRSRSTLFASMRVIKQLEGKVPTESLQRMSRQNAEVLVEVTKSGGKITPAVLKCAERESEAKLRQVVRLPKTDALRTTAHQKGPIPEAEAVGRRFERAVKVATWLVQQAKRDKRRLSLRDRAIDLIVSEFLASHEADYAQAHGRKGPQKVSVAQAEEKVARTA